MIRLFQTLLKIQAIQIIKKYGCHSINDASFDTTAPCFTLQDVREDHLFSLSEPAGEKGLLVSFICNHCPYVIHILSSLTQNCHG